MLSDTTLQTTVLEILKTRLNHCGSALDEYLTARAVAAAREIEATGITLRDDDVRDVMLVVDLAAYEYSNRDKTGAWPEWLRLARRERWLQERRDASDS